ncbi:MAG TPA: hypothetical protein VKB52_17300, partial [Rhodanobacteraceae bacterium]|nr:hypothetical protein [Rhodanobacteraceae bacterium]
MIPQRQPRPPPPPQRDVAGAVQPPQLRGVARLRFKSDRLPWQRSLRWKPPPPDRRLILLGILLAVLFTVVELVGFGLGMRLQIAQVIKPPKPRTVEVVLIEPPPTLPTPPEPEPPPF